MRNQTAVTRFSIACAAALFLAGCVTQSPRQDRYEQTQYYEVQGTIHSIETVSEKASQPSGVGMVGGAIVGGILGSQVGRGTGRTLATVAGAAAGAYGGNEVEKNYSGNSQAYRITVRARDGRLLSYVQDDVQGLRVGDRVRVSQNKVFADY